MTLQKTEFELDVPLPRKVQKSFSVSKQANKQVYRQDNSKTRQRRDFGFFVKDPVQFKEELISFWGMISHATDSKKAQMYFSIQKTNYLIIEISKVATIFLFYFFLLDVK